MLEGFLNCDFHHLLLFPTVIQMTGDDPISSDPPAFWKTLLKSMGNTTFTSSVQHLLCLQWAVWLAKCQLKTIQEFQVRSCLEIVFPSNLFGIHPVYFGEAKEMCEPDLTKGLFVTLKSRLYVMNM